MSEEVIVTGKTVEEAMNKAVAEYSGRNASYDLIETPKKGFLGIGSSPAKIRVTLNDEDEITLSDIVSSVKDMKISTDRGGNGERRHERAADRKPSPKTEKSAEKKEVQKKTPSIPKETEKAAVPHVSEHREIIVTEEEKQYALEFVSNLLVNMEIDATARFDGVETVKEGETSYPRLVIEGENAGILIGHHGETLDAIQYLVNLSALRRGGSTQKEFVKIVVDIENYRAKREETLRSLARRMASNAQKYKRNVLLEPMNPYERRIIHSEIQGFENVSTHSVGSDENRKIVITYEGEDKVDKRSHRFARKESVSKQDGEE